ncbi:uncharacterized protein LOC117122470 [Anneissia japonica]|uniref:uncharacterized protein LOC117122470 n=1 Tax=Anneissia japonica TaxID=1529436 RepID=UPI00142578A2|nr:uncharacterized protein LOC117122470 [Anneissia japonica]XP_033123946.1 uncharacterized protein LOC117122470 [Anneissia japonica]XP_033123947.1 uncharacterized protein LOC117122470 [Anneissia japonica]
MEHGKKSNRIVRPLTAPVIRTSSRQNGPPSSKSSHQTTRVRPATAKASIQLPPRSPSPGHSQYIESLFQTSDRLILGRSVKTNRGEKGWIGCLRTPQYHSSIGHSQTESSRQEQLTSETTRPDNSDSDDEAGATPYDTKKVIDETNEKLKRNLHQRLTAHKNIGITSDVIFQMQLRSSFWTSDMLYHNWGSHLLDLRERNCQSSGNIGNISKESTEEEPLPQTNERRAAICFHMAHNTPLSIGTLGSLSSANHREVIIDRKTRRSSNILPEKSGEPEVEDPISRRIRLRETLKRAIRIIKIVSLIASCMLRSSKDSTTETFVAQLHYITSRPENLPFNKKRFLKDNSLRVPSWLPQIADTLPKDRTPEAIYKLYGVMNDMKSFERFTPKVRLELCRVARYMSCGKGRVIVRQGHVGFGFYFIYSGSVFVQLDIADQTGVVTSQTVNIIGKGACFGELALLGDGRRTASIICRETTELFEIEKDTFLESCPYIYEDELNEKIDIASKFEFFRKWPKSSLHRLCFESQIQEVPYGRIVDRDTVATDYLYFVLKGKLVMLKELDLTRFIKSNNQLSLKIYAGKQLPTPRPHTSSIGGSKTFPHATKHNKCYIKIGDIQDGQSTVRIQL